MSKTLRVNESTWQKLGETAGYKDTMDSVIIRLLETYEYAREHLKKMELKKTKGKTSGDNDRNE